MKRATVVKNIHKIYSYENLLPALSFTGVLPRSGDLLAIQMSLATLERSGYICGLLYIVILFAASEVERKTGFITYNILQPMYSKSMSAKYMGWLRDKGYLEETTFPDTFSHIVRRKRVYRISEKGRKCLRLFRDTYNEYQREVKRAKVSSMEGL